MVRIAGLLLVIAATGANAQMVVDESGKNVPGDRLRAAIKLAADQFPDPETVKFRNITLQKGGILLCGELNPKNLYGAYDGYRAFKVIGDYTALVAERGAGEALAASYKRLFGDCPEMSAK